ncbi:hypothetical protein [Agromyces sp. LHK192]|uniref:hypothetical protein n=1 Tax=Agromyces sp. LHK192 TaxID=2498704 RepID=UPI000FDAFD89|nr:hypothetical protein [Agromyces sp. LHK192]
MSSHRLRRIAGLLLLAAVTAGGLSGCAVDYFAKTNEGQQRVDQAIAAAGLQDVVEAEFSCTGALPLTATTCRPKVTITTDDLDDVQAAIGIQALRAEPDESRWTLVYQGRVYRGAPDDLRRAEAIAPTLPTDADVDEVLLAADGYTLWLDGVTTFDRLCRIATSADPAPSITSRSAGAPDLEIRADAPGSDGFAEACGFADTAIDDLGGAHLTRVGLSRAEDGLVEVTVISDSEQARDAAVAWAETVTVPSGVDLDVGVYY